MDKYSKLPPIVGVMVSEENAPSKELLEKTLEASTKPLNLLESLKKGYQKEWEKVITIYNLKSHLIEDLGKTHFYEDRLDKTKKIVEFLKDKGVNLNAIKDENENNLVKIAVMNRKWSKAKLFIESGVNPLEKGKDGKSALDVIMEMSASRPQECLEVALAILTTTIAGGLASSFWSRDHLYKVD